MPRDAILVGCGSLKVPTASAARDLYTGALYRQQRRYAEASGKPWAILSARYGLLLPETVVDPYDLRLDQLTPQEQRAWAVGVRDALEKWCYPSKLVVLASGPYVEGLRPAMLGMTIEEPLAGLGLGFRLQRLKRMIRELPHAG